MPSNDPLVAYVLDTLAPGDRADVEARLAANPDDAERVERMRRVVQVLEGEADAIDPPPGLAVAAVARTARYLVVNGLTSHDADAQETLRPGNGLPKFKKSTSSVELPALPDLPAVPVSGAAASPRPSRPERSDPLFPVWLKRPDTVVAALILFLAVGIGVTAIAKVREDGQVRACQGQLRELHQALDGYSDATHGQFPQVGTPTVPVAGALAAELVRAGQLAPTHSPSCPVAALHEPAVPLSGEPVRYAYTLGYVNPAGQVVGLRRDATRAAAEDWCPIAADLTGAGRATVHARGQNVLFVGGTVRYTLTTAAGPNGDDIYRNEAGLARAGLHLWDTSLGQTNDRP